MPSSTGWLFSPSPVLSGDLRLFCFPYAGGGVSVFSGWHKSFADVDLVCVQLPGRDGKRHEPPQTDFSTLIQRLADGIRPALDTPAAFFGHSMGGLIAFELARELRRRSWPLPVQVFVSASRAPQFRFLDAGERPLRSLPDEQFIHELQRRFGLTPEFADNPELVELFLPLLRADLALCESYRHVSEAPLDCPISTFGGTEDMRVRSHHLAGWRDHTSATFSERTFPGDHFFIRRDSLSVVEAVKQQLARIPQRVRGVRP
jgi:surfactin synthase thioesterase subunit